MFSQHSSEREAQQRKGFNLFFDRLQTYERSAAGRALERQNSDMRNDEHNGVVGNAAVRVARDWRLQSATEEARRGFGRACGVEGGEEVCVDPAR